jgi:hypothetical protein
VTDSNTGLSDRIRPSGEIDQITTCAASIRLR